MALLLSRMERQILAGFAVSVVVMAVLHEVVEVKEVGMKIQSQLLEDYYSVLGVADTASKQEIMTAYRRATNQFQSKPQHEETRVRRAKIVSAHETLSNPEKRAAYDSRRRVVKLSVQALTAICVGLPLLGVLYGNVKLIKHINRNRGYCVDPKSLEGRICSTFAKMETMVQVALEKAPGERLGMQMSPAEGGTLQVTSLAEGSVTEFHNQLIRDDKLKMGSPGYSAWWRTTEVLVGDIMCRVNGVSTPREMMNELQERTTLDITMQRSMKGLLPCVSEASLIKATPDQRWGCQMGVAKDGSNTLEVLGVEPGGAADNWNEAHPGLRIQVGDRIAAVNRVVGAQQMLTALKDPATTRSNWILVRGVHAGPRLPEVACGPLRKRDGDKLGIRIGAALESPIRNHIVEVGEGGVTVVKEVVPGYLVDQWNQRQGAQQVVQGALVLSVNGRTNPSEFATELSKPTVTIRTRPPRGAIIRAATADGTPAGADGGRRLQPEATPRQLVLDEKPALARRLFGSWAPGFLLPRSFEARLKEHLGALRFEFNVEVDRIAGTDGPKKVGLQLSPGRDNIGGLEVSGVHEDGIIAEYNRSGVAGPDTVRPGDRLIAVNDSVTAPAMMIEVLSNVSVQRLKLRLSRRPTDAAPGVWEAEVERRPGEGWGLVLKESVITGGTKGRGPLFIEGISADLAVGRWNLNIDGQRTWKVEIGDLIVGCGQEVGHNRMLEHLKTADRTRLTLLRWNAGPAPEAIADGQKVLDFEVVLEKSSPDDKLGVRLDPSTRNPTFTAISEVVAGGMVDSYNQRLLAGAPPDAEQRVVRKGDEVDSVNGVRDPSRFGEGCKAQRVVLHLRRWSCAQVPDVLREPQRKLPGIPSTPVATAPPLAQASGAAPPPAPKEAAALAPPPMVAPQATPVPADLLSAQGPRSPAHNAWVAPAPSATTAAPPAASEAPPAHAESGTETPYDGEAGAAMGNNGLRRGSEPFSPTTPSSAQAARETLLLKAELEQMRRRLSSQGHADELGALRAERDALQSERDELKARVSNLDRNSGLLRRSAEQADKLRVELSQLRRQEQRFEDTLRRNAELSKENARLASENERLEARLARADDAEERAVPDGAFQCLDDGLTRLQELSISLEDVLAREAAL